MGSETRKSGNKANKGVRELKRLQCSVNYEGRKKEGEKKSEEAARGNLLHFYED